MDHLGECGLNRRGEEIKSLSKSRAIVRLGITDGMAI